MFDKPTPLYLGSLSNVEVGIKEKVKIRRDQREDGADKNQEENKRILSIISVFLF